MAINYRHQPGVGAMVSTQTVSSNSSSAAVGACDVVPLENDTSDVVVIVGSSDVVAASVSMPVVAESSSVAVVLGVASGMLVVVVG